MLPPPPGLEAMVRVRVTPGVAGIIGTAAIAQRAPVLIVQLTLRSFTPPFFSESRSVVCVTATVIAGRSLPVIVMSVPCTATFVPGGRSM